MRRTHQIWADKAFAGLLLIFPVLAFVGTPSLMATDDYVPPRVGYIEGSGAYESAGDVDWSELTINLPLLSGDRIVAHPDSRIEIELGYDNFLRLGAGTDVSFRRATGSELELDLSLGELILRVNESARLRVFTPEATVEIKKEGLYRISVDDNGGAAVTVRKGEVRVANGFRERKLRAGEQLVIDGPQSSLSQVVRSWGDDEFDVWSDRRDALYVGSGSTQYVSSSYAGVYDLDAYGSWDYVPDYGTSIWFPFGVSSSWSPYSVGHWRYYPTWGWTWISFESWGWLPYHYGNWYFHAGRWGWCPGRFSTWSPALVDFYYGGGYVGWAPRGYFGGRGGGGVTVINNNTIVNNNGWSGRGGARHGLTVVSERDFGSTRSLDQVAVREPGTRVVDGLRPTVRTELPIRPVRNVGGSNAAGISPTVGVSGLRGGDRATGQNPRVTVIPASAAQDSNGARGWSTRGGRATSEPAVVTLPNTRPSVATGENASPAVSAPQPGRGGRNTGGTPSVTVPRTPDRTVPTRTVSRPDTTSRTPSRAVPSVTRGTPDRRVTPAPPSRPRTPSVTRAPSGNRTPSRVAPSRGSASAPSRSVAPSRPATRPSSPPRASSSPPRVSRPAPNRDRKP